LTNNTVTHPAAKRGRPLPRKAGGEVKSSLIKDVRAANRGRLESHVFHAGEQT
jgi:hypothetical protein